MEIARGRITCSGMGGPLADADIFPCIWKVQTVKRLPVASSSSIHPPYGLPIANTYYSIDQDWALCGVFSLALLPISMGKADKIPSSRQRKNYPVIQCQQCLPIPRKSAHGVETWPQGPLHNVPLNHFGRSRGTTLKIHYSSNGFSSLVKAERGPENIAC